MAYIGLGSNLPSTSGTPAETIEAALVALGAIGKVTARSSLYETAPVGMTDQPAFVNAAVALKTINSPDVLLEQLLAIECDFGRDRSSSPPKGPRTLDLDILLVDNLIRNAPALSLPHPALAERRFVLVPLVEIAPELWHPVLHKTLQDLLAALPGDDVVRILRARP